MLAKNILVPIDFSDSSTRALDYACELAKKLDATVHLLNCFGPFTPEVNLALTQAMIETIREDAAAALEKVMAARSGIRFGKAQLVRLDPRDGILEVAAASKIDLVVMGTHGRRGFSRLVLGSVAEHVVRRATCPVLTLRGSDE